MKILKILLGIIVVLAVIFFVGGIFLPKTYSVSRSIVINAPDSVVYKNISDFNHFLKWNPWSKMDPAAKVTISGEIAQPGHQYEWEGEKSGKGQMKLIEVRQNQMTAMELKFIKPFESFANTRFDIESTNAGNRVTWLMTGENKGTLNKWMGLMMDKMIGKDFNDGLNALKLKSESEK